MEHPLGSQRREGSRKAKSHGTQQQERYTAFKRNCLLRPFFQAHCPGGW